MNPKLKELVDEAWLEVEGPPTIGGEQVDMRDVLINELAPHFERLCEKIVQECASSCERSIPLYMDHKDYVAILRAVKATFK